MPSRRNPAQLDDYVIAAVGDSPHPATAYELLRRLTAKRQSMAPQQLYRTLERLIAGGKVIRIETLRAYREPRCPGEVDGPLIVCRSCRSAMRANGPDFAAELMSRSEATGFQPRRLVIEIVGTCAQCRAKSRNAVAASHAA